MYKYFNKKPPNLYHGFNTRSYLLLDNIPFNKDAEVLEIGVGSGGIINHLIGNIKEYYGIDISKQTIDLLSVKHSFIDTVKFMCLDVCNPISSLNKRFDIIFSADTLEHVQSPQLFFNFISRHLKDSGMAIVIFPNESEIKHHGITWFENKNDLFIIIGNSHLKVSKILEIDKTISHKFIGYFLWKLPKSLINFFLLKQSDLPPQSFEQTDAFVINRNGGIKANIFELYGKSITRLARVFELYKVRPLVQASIKNKYLLINIIK